MIVHLRDGTKIKGVVRIRPMKPGPRASMLELFNSEGRRINRYPNMQDVTDITSGLFSAAPKTEVPSI